MQSVFGQYEELFKFREPVSKAVKQYLGKEEPKFKEYSYNRQLEL